MIACIRINNPVAHIRLADQRLVTAAGESGTTVELPNVTVRGARDSRGFCEVTVTKRNLI